jgi:ParB family chromosome partitioning protein
LNVSKERRLGRGLEALLGRPPEGYGDGEPQQLNVTGDDSGGNLVQVNVYELDSNPYQPRRDFDEADLNSLAESIKQHGLIQPLCVRHIGGRYQLVAGERRLRAAIKAGWSEVPAQVIEADDRQVAELAIVENLQRKDLNALEKAASFQQYLERYQCTQEELAQRLQIDRSTVANLIRLLDLPDDVQQAVRTGGISPGHARALLPLGDEREQIEFCRRIQTEGLSVRNIESLVQEAMRDGELNVVSSEGERSSAPKLRSEHLGLLEQEFRTALGTKVDVRQTSKGRGRLVIHFKTHDEFERLRSILLGDEYEQHRNQVG